MMIQLPEKTHTNTQFCHVHDVIAILIIIIINTY